MSNLAKTKSAKLHKSQNPSKTRHTSCRYIIFVWGVFVCLTIHVHMQPVEVDPELGYIAEARLHVKAMTTLENTWLENIESQFAKMSEPRHPNLERCL